MQPPQGAVMMAQGSGMRPGSASGSSVAARPSSAQGQVKLPPPSVLDRSLPHHTHPLWNDLVARPLWQVLLKSDTLRRALQEHTVTKLFPVAEAPGGPQELSPVSLRPGSPAVIDRPASRVSEAPSGLRPVEAVTSTRALRELRRPRSATPTSNDASAINYDNSASLGITVFDEGAFGARYTTWMSKNRWRRQADRSVEIFTLAKSMLDSHPALFQYFLSREVDTPTPATQKYFTRVNFKTEPISPGLGVDTLLRNQRVAEALHKWWESCPKIISRSGESTARPGTGGGSSRPGGPPAEAASTVVLRGKVVQLLVRLHGALLFDPVLSSSNAQPSGSPAGDDALTSQALAIATEIVENDVAAICGNEAMGIGPTLFKAIVLAAVEPWMETYRVEERVEALDALYDQIFAGPGMLLPASGKVEQLVPIPSVEPLPADGTISITTEGADAEISPHRDGEMGEAAVGNRVPLLSPEALVQPGAPRESVHDIYARLTGMDVTNPRSTHGGSGVVDGTHEIHKRDAVVSQITRLVDVLDHHETHQPPSSRPASAVRRRILDAQQRRNQLALTKQSPEQQQQQSASAEGFAIEGPGGISEIGNSTNELSGLQSDHRAQAYVADTAPKWREHLRRERILNNEDAGKRAMCPSRAKNRAFHEPSRTYGLERVLLERLTRRVADGEGGDPVTAAEHARVLRYVSTAVIPKHDVDEFVRRHPASIDHFRATVEVQHLDEASLGNVASSPTRDRPSSPAGGDATVPLFPSTSKLPRHMKATGNTKAALQSQRAGTLFVRRGSGNASMQSTRREHPGLPNPDAKGAMTRSLPVWRKAGKRKA